MALLVFAFAGQAFANPTPKFAYVANSGSNNVGLHHR